MSRTLCITSSVLATKHDLEAVEQIMSYVSERSNPFDLSSTTLTNIVVCYHVAVFVIQLKLVISSFNFAFNIALERTINAEMQK